MESAFWFVVFVFAVCILAALALYGLCLLFLFERGDNDN